MADARLRHVLPAALALMLVTGTVAGALTLRGGATAQERLRGSAATTVPAATTSTTTPATSPATTPATTPAPPAPTTPATTAVTAAVVARPLRGVVVVVDPGHNGGNSRHLRTVNRRVNAGNGIRKACNTTGTASRNGYTEHAYTWDVANRLAAELRRRGATVVLTRPDDTGVGPCVDARAAVANRAAAANRGRTTLLVSIHADGNLSPSARGFHVIRSTSMAGGPGVVKRSERLALAVRAAFRAGTGMPYSTYLGRGTAITPRRDIGTLNLSRVPGVMIETGNLRHPKDLALLRSAAFRAKEAKALADGLQAYLAG